MALGGSFLGGDVIAFGLREVDAETAADAAATTTTMMMAKL